MSPPREGPLAAERYDHARRYARHHRLPADDPRPQPPSAWPAENVALLERYQDWLLSGGASQEVVDRLYIPMAGHALGLNLKPHPELDIDADLERALDYVKAKRLSTEWTDMCRIALDKFRRFLRQERGLPEVSLRPFDPARYCTGLPDWLVRGLERYQHLRQGNWRPARLNQQLQSFWGGHTRLWRWLFEHYPITHLTDIKRQHILDYVDHRLAQGRAVSTINGELRYFQSFLRFLQNQDYAVPQALLRIPGLKQPDSLPRFLTDEQVRRLRDDFEARVAQANTPVRQRDALLDRAAFYLLWQAGSRLGEVEELRLDDLDLPGRKLMVRQGKGNTDRTVYLTDTVVRALREYLAARGLGSTDQVFLYRNQPIKKDLIHSRIQAAGQRVGVRVSPHRLRHTCATQLLNAGCRVTSIQKFLGHQRLNATMIYARVHDRTVAEDYYAAMEQVEKRLELASPVADGMGERMDEEERAQLLELATQLAEPELSVQVRLALVEQMRRVLNGEALVQDENQARECGRRQRAPPPPSPACVGASVV